VTDGRGQSVRAPGLASWLARIAPRAARGEISIALVSDARIRALNKRFRRKATSTDVLSFAERQPASPNGHGVPPPPEFPSGASPGAQALRARMPKFLGDIVISTVAAQRQARSARHSYASELKVLALHGLLHLLGYDHEDPADRGRMARLERRLRAHGGLPAGLIERGAKAAARNGAPASIRSRAPAARATRHSPSRYRAPAGQPSAGDDGALRPAPPKLARNTGTKAGAPASIKR
jgi:probable rRNA maturation factor